MAMTSTVRRPVRTTEADEYKRIAAELLGTANLQWSFHGVPEIAAGWKLTVANNGSRGGVDGYAPVLSSNTDANGRADIHPENPSASVMAGGVTAGGSSGEFYLAARMKVRHTATGGEVLAVGLTHTTPPTTKYLLIGVHGSYGPTRFVVVSDAGGFICGDSDTSWHVFEVWRKGGTTYARVDGGAISSGNFFPAAAAAGQMLYPFARADNAGVTANREIALNWLAVAYPRA